MFGLLSGKAYIETQREIDANYSEAIKATANLPSIYKAARPIILFASTLAVIPHDWRQVLQALIFCLDNQLIRAAIEPPTDTPIVA